VVAAAEIILERHPYSDQFFQGLNKEAKAANG
jgi:hypothetical protein